MLRKLVLSIVLCCGLGVKAQPAELTNAQWVALLSNKVAPTMSLVVDSDSSVFRLLGIEKSLPNRYTSNSKNSFPASSIRRSPSASSCIFSYEKAVSSGVRFRYTSDGDIQMMLAFNSPNGLAITSRKSLQGCVIAGPDLGPQKVLWSGETFLLCRISRNENENRFFQIESLIVDGTLERGDSTPPSKGFRSTFPRFLKKQLNQFLNAKEVQVALEKILAKQ